MEVIRRRGEGLNEALSDVDLYSAGMKEMMRRVKGGGKAKMKRRGGRR